VLVTQPQSIFYVALHFCFVVSLVVRQEFGSRGLWLGGEHDQLTHDGPDLACSVQCVHMYMKSAESFMDAAKHTTLLQVYYMPLPHCCSLPLFSTELCAGLGPGVWLVKEC
jgi:hypothetical protein